MDAFSRLLASIGQSLGRGLGQVGQTELEQRQRLEALEFQRKANISGQLLQTFTQLLNTQGIQEVEPGGIDAIKQAITDLALGKIDSPAVQEAIAVFPRVADSANKIAIYRELATKDLDALSRLVANTTPDEAQKFLNAVGLGGMYEGLRSRGEILNEADRLGLQLTREQIEDLAARRKALLAKLEPEIELLREQGRLTKAQADEIIAKLPLVLTRLQLEAQNLAVQIRKGEIEVSRLDEILDAQIKKDLAAVGVSEAQAAVLREQIGLIREQIKSEVLRQAQIEAETERTRAQTELTREQRELIRAEAELARARAQQITATLEPTIRSILADIALKEAQAGEVAARTEAILQRLPLELENLILDIRKKQIELDRLPDYLDAQLKKMFADIGLTEAQTGLTEANIALVRERVKSEVLNQLKTEAEIELIKRQADLVAENIKTAAQERGIKLTQSATNWLKDIFQLAVELSADTPEKAKELLQGFGNFYKLSDDFINFTAGQIATAVKEAKFDRDLQRTGALANAIGQVMNTAMAAESPEAARKVANAILPPSVSPEVRTLVGNMAYYLKTLRLSSDIATIIEPYMKVLPQTPEDESRLLGKLYDSIVGLKGNTPEGRRIANGIVNTIKGQWALTRALQALEREGKKADIDKDKALTALYRVQATLAPKQFSLEEQKLAFEREQFSFEKWYKTEQVKLGWARLELDRLIAEAKAAGAGEDVIEALKDLASVAEKADKLAVRALATRLRQLNKDNCARKLESAGSITIVEAVRANDTECNAVIAQILTDKVNEENRRVAEQAEWAVELGRYVTGLALGFVSGGGTPGGAAPATPGTSGRPSGTAVPGGTTTPGSAPTGVARGALAGDFDSGVKVAYNRLREFKVQIPNDPKLVGAMVFVYGTEFGPWYNPFQVTEGAGVPMQTITIKENGVEKKVKVPVGPDKGFQAVIDADKPGTRKKALAIDSAIAFGIAWIFPNETRNPGMLAKYIREDFRNSNPGLFRRADYFKSRTGEVDMVAVAAAYADMSLEKLGTPIRYTKAYTGLLRLLAQHDLDMLRMGKPLPPEQAKQRYLNMVKSDPRLLEAVRKQFPELDRKQAFERLLAMAENLYEATRLSNIGNLVLGGGR